MKILETIENSRIFAILMIIVYLPLAWFFFILYWLFSGEKIKELEEEYDDF